MIENTKVDTLARALTTLTEGVVKARRERDLAAVEEALAALAEARDVLADDARRAERRAVLKATLFPLTEAYAALFESAILIAEAEDVIATGLAMLEKGAEGDGREDDHDDACS